MTSRPSRPLFIALAVALAVSSLASAQVREETAVTGARDWLAIVDAEQYDRSWQEAGEIIRNATTADRWAASLTGLRKAFGGVRQRDLKAVVVTENLPNAPEGKYVVSTFETTFQQGEPMVEIVTSYLEPSNQWEVVGYSLKKAGENGQAQQQGQQQQQPAQQQPPAQEQPAAPPPPQSDQN